MTKWFWFFVVLSIVTPWITFEKLCVKTLEEFVYVQKLVDDILDEYLKPGFIVFDTNFW